MTKNNYTIKTAAIIQARAASTRLPEKALMKLAGMTMIEHVIERAKLIEGVDRVILATGEGSANDVLADIADSRGIYSFRGSENDVLSRFHSAVKNDDFGYIIRITGDNPFTDYISASRALSLAIEESADHCTVKDIPLGTGVEVVSRSALERCFIEGIEAHHREHVTPYIKENPGLFKIIKYSSNLKNPFPDLRLTVDTDTDAKLAKAVYDNVYSGTPFTLEEVIEYITANPELALINSEVKQRPMTHSSNG